MSNVTHQMRPADLAFCEEHNLDPAAYRSLVTFLRSNLASNPQLQALAAKHPGEFMRAGVEAWNRKSQQFFGEILENKTGQARQWRHELTEQVYNECRSAA